jgi:hypothetical protein
VRYQALVTSVYTSAEQKQSFAVLAILSIIAVISRFYKINEPDEVV